MTRGERSLDRQGLVVEGMFADVPLRAMGSHWRGWQRGWHSCTAVSDHATPLPGLSGKVTGAQGEVVPLALGTEGGQRGLLGSSMGLAARAKSASQNVGLEKMEYPAQLLEGADEVAGTGVPTGPPAQWWQSWIRNGLLVSPWVLTGLRKAGWAAVTGSDGCHLAPGRCLSEAPPET